MIPNLLELVKGEFTNDPVGKIAGSLGESSTATMSAIGAAAPALLAGLISKASTTQGANDLLSLLRQGGFEGQGVSLASALSGGDGLSSLVTMGTPLLSSIFGNRANHVIDWLSSQARVSRSSANTILGLVTPVLLAIIGRQLASSGFNASSLMSLLAAQRSYVQNAAPSGLAAALGLASLADRGSEAAGAAASIPATGRSSPRRWLVPLLALILLILLFRNRCAPEQTPVATTPETPPAAEPTPTERPLIEQPLPGGARLTVPKGGTEELLVLFIEDKTRPVDETTWFSFDRLEFDTDSATLRPSSQEQLRNIAAILAAYPAVEVKIGGYTDNVGDDAHNLQLSQDRARSTMQALIDLGVAPGRITAEGYGKEHPIADNSTPEGRQQNRRIDIRVTKK